MSIFRRRVRRPSGTLEIVLRRYEHGGMRQRTHFLGDMWAEQVRGGSKSLMGMVLEVLERDLRELVRVEETREE